MNNNTNNDNSNRPMHVEFRKVGCCQILAIVSGAEVRRVSGSVEGRWIDLFRPAHGTAPRSTQNSTASERPR